MTIIQQISVWWFMSAILMEVGGNIVFLFWLKKLGIRTTLGLRGIPGYLEYAYFNWCKDQGRSSKRILILRALCFANVILAAIVVIPMMMSVHAK